MFDDMKEGGRKYNITLLVIVVTVLAAACGWIHEDSIVRLLLGALGVYGVANVAQKAADWLLNKGAAPPAEAPK